MTNHIMLDIETMSTSTSAAIASIGAVRFDHTGTLDDFYVTVNLESCTAVGLRIDAATVEWWMQQSDQARMAFGRPSFLLPAALHAFGEFIGRDATVWGNGSDFDNTILANAFRACSIDLPWSWSKNRCYRTIKNMVPNCEIVRVGTHHNALADALSQAGHLLECLEVLGKGIYTTEFFLDPKNDKDAV
jgi:exodeoxyribonuclease VIII